MILTDVGATIQKCMGGAATKIAKTFQLVLNTLNASARLSRFQSVDGTSKIGLTVDDSTMASRGG